MITINNIATRHTAIKTLAAIDPPILAPFEVELV